MSSSELKNKSIRGGAVTLVAQVLEFALRLGVTAVLGRLLMPDDYGLVAMVAAVTGFVAMFKDLGLSTATIQKDVVTEDEIHALFWINAAVGLVITLVVAALSPAIAWFYGEPRLLGITLLLSLSFLFGGITVQHQAMLRRQMRFGILMVVQLSALVIGMLTGILLAWFGAGYWSLVIMQIVIVGCVAAGVWIAGQWVPRRPAGVGSVRSMIRFGMDITLFNVINYFARNADSILLGRFQGPAVLGLYSKACELLLLPVTNLRFPLEQVALPAMSRLQNEPDRFRRYYFEFVSVLAFLAMPVMMFAFCCAYEIIIILLGDRWLGSVEILRIMAVLAFIQPVAGSTGLVMISLGQTQRYLRWGVVYSLCIVASFLAGLPWGAIGVATSYTLVSYLVLIPSLWYAFRNSPVRLSTFFSAIFKPAITSVIMGGAIVSLGEFWRTPSMVTTLFANFLLGAIVYFVSWIVLPGGLKTLKEYFAYVRLIFGKREIEN